MKDYGCIEIIENCIPRRVKTLEDVWFLFGWTDDAYQKIKQTITDELLENGRFPYLTNTKGQRVHLVLVSREDTVDRFVETFI